MEEIEIPESVITDMEKEEEKVGYTDEEMRDAQRRNLENTREERKLSSTGRIRITSGGNQSDFEEMENAMKYLKNSIITYAHAGIHIIHPELFWKNGEPDIKQAMENVQ